MSTPLEYSNTTFFHAELYCLSVPEDQDAQMRRAASIEKLRSLRDCQIISMRPRPDRTSEGDKHCCGVGNIDCLFWEGGSVGLSITKRERGTSCSRKNWSND